MFCSIANMNVILMDATLATGAAAMMAIRILLVKTCLCLVVVLFQH